MVEKLGSSHSQSSRTGNEMQILQVFMGVWSKNQRATSHDSSSIQILLSRFIRKHPVDETITAWKVGWTAVQKIRCYDNTTHHSKGTFTDWSSNTVEKQTIYMLNSKTLNTTDPSSWYTLLHVSTKTYYSIYIYIYIYVCVCVCVQGVRCNC